MSAVLILGKRIAGTILLSLNLDVNSNILLTTGLLYLATDDRESRIFLVFSVKHIKIIYH